MWLPDEIPQSILIAAIGRPLCALIDHPVLTGAANLIIEGQPPPRKQGGSLVWFASPQVGFDARVPHMAGAPALFTDPTLAGTAAVEDVLLRMAICIRARGLFPNTHLLVHQARLRIGLINAARPHEEPLPSPTREQAERAGAPPASAAPAF